MPKTNMQNPKPRPPKTETKTPHYSHLGPGSGLGSPSLEEGLSATYGLVIRMSAKLVWPAVVTT